MIKSPQEVKHQKLQAIDMTCASKAEADPLALPIVLRICTARVVCATIVSMGLFIVLTYAMIDGFRISTINASTLSDSEMVLLLDRYNSYSGSIASIVSVPFQQFVLMLVPVFFLCFVTKSVVQPHKSFSEQWAPIFVAAGISWLLGQGFNAMNVHFDAPEVEFVISNDDLVDSEPNLEFDFVVTNWTDTTHIGGIPSTDTILRSAIRPSSPDSKTSCQNVGGPVYGLLEASVRYGFPINSWFQYMLPESIASGKSFSFSMSDDFADQDIGAAVFLNEDLEQTAQLFSYGFWGIWQQFGGWQGVGPDLVEINLVHERVRSEDAAELVKNIQHTMNNATAELKNFHDPATIQWLNISIPEATFEFSSFPLSPDIVFDAITFELPVKTSTMNYLLGADENASNVSIHFDTFNDCDDHACVLKTPLTPETIQDQVRLLRLCMTQVNRTQDDLVAFATAVNSDSDTECRFVSNSSVLIYSVARHLSVEEVKLNVTDTEHTHLEAKSPRFTYKVTVGKVSWQTRDLADVYGADCGATDGTCHGLNYPLSTGKHHIVVGDRHLPVPHTIMYPLYYTSWQVLALAATRISTSEQGDIVYPPIYPFSNKSLPWTQLSGYNCSYIDSAYINDIIQRHIYSKDSIQPAYTAGLFWLFQNGAVKSIKMGEPQDLTRLDFKGNRIWVSSRVSIPDASAVMTFIACGLVSIAGLLVALWSISVQRQSTLSNQISAHTIASVRIDARQYPPALIQAVVQLHSSSDGMNENAVSIRDFEIAATTLNYQDPGGINRKIEILQSQTRTKEVDDELTSKVLTSMAAAQLV